MHAFLPEAPKTPTSCFSEVRSNDGLRRIKNEMESMKAADFFMLFLIQIL